MLNIFKFYKIPLLKVDSLWSLDKCMDVGSAVKEKVEKIMATPTTQSGNR